MKNINILVTGAAGFIGSALARYIIKNSNASLIILDKLTYASNLNGLNEIINNKRVFFFKGSIGNKKLLESIFKKFYPTYILNLAAESHVDKSILDPDIFIKTNILDTHILLKSSLNYFLSLDKAQSRTFKFIQISTDEVYGDINSNQNPVKETAAYNPSSPYSASKAAGDHIVKAYFRTFGFPGLITNCCNNYGPFQNKEKFIPVIINSILNKERIPVYGDGKQIREWIYVDDHCEAILKLAKFGICGENYNIGNGKRLTNLEIIEKILNVLKRKKIIKNSNMNEYISHVEDRVGHDRKYAINSSKIRRLCNWKPSTNFSNGIEKTINSFIN